MIGSPRDNFNKDKEHVKPERRIKRTVIFLMRKKNVIIAGLLAASLISGGAYVVRRDINKRAHAFIELGDKYAKEEKYEEAVREYNSALQLDKKNNEAKRALAQAYITSAKQQLAMESVDKAREEFKKALEVDSSNPHIYISIAEAYAYFSEAYEEGIDILDKGYKTTGSKDLLTKREELLSNVPGNTADNLLNKGYAAEQEDWIYYVNVSDKESIYKIRNDGTGKTKVGGEQCSFLNIAGDYIYYVSTNSIYRIKKDGTQNQKIREVKQDDSIIAKSIEGNFSNSFEEEYKDYAAGRGKGGNYIRSMVLQGDVLYYAVSINVRYPGYLIAIDKEGGFQKSIPLPISPTGMALMGNRVFYWSSSGLSISPIYELDLENGKNEIAADISRSSISKMNLSRGMLYFLRDEEAEDKESYEMKMYKKNIEGTEQINISPMNLKDTSINAININRAEIYYIEMGSLYRANLEGGDQTKLCDVEEADVYYINTAGDWLYISCINYDESYNGSQNNMFRLKIDGTHKEKIK